VKARRQQQQNKWGGWLKKKNGKLFVLFRCTDILLKKNFLGNYLRAGWNAASWLTVLKQVRSYISRVAPF
jgi:hypothetical protein